MRSPIVLTVVLILSTTQFALAQEDNTIGVQIGVHGGLTSWDLGDIEGNVFDKETGPLFGGSFGWGMSDWLGLFARADWTTISPEEFESYKVLHADLGIRAIPQLLGPTIRPYFEVLASFRDLTLIETNDLEVAGTGAGFGGGLGLYFFVSEKFAMNAGFAAALGGLDQATFGGFPIEGSVSATALRLIAGVTVFP